MTDRARRARAEQDLVRHCHAGLGSDALRAQVLRDLRKLMSIDAMFFATADPETLLFTGAYAEAALAPVGALFMDNEFGARDVNQFASLATAPTQVATLDDATRGERLASPRYRDIMRPIGLGDELRAALSVGSEVWGYLCLHREDGGAGFAEAEAATLGRVDLAITLGRPWPIEPDHVDLILRGLSLVLPKAVVPELAHGFNATYQLRLRGQGTYAFRFEEGELSIGCQYEGRIDCRISADPATYLLVASGRRGLVRPALTGQMIVYGRRPWLANRFAKLVEAP